MRADPAFEALQHDAAGEHFGHDLERGQGEIRDEKRVALHAFAPIGGEGEFDFLDHRIGGRPLDERSQAIEKCGFLHRLDVEEDHGAVAENDRAAAAPGLKRQRRGGQAAGLAQRAGVDVTADAKRADADFPAAFKRCGRCLGSSDALI